MTDHDVDEIRERARPVWLPDLPGFIAISMILIFAAVIGMLCFKPMPLTEAAGALLTTMIGMLITKVGTMVDFYFGSSKSNKEKDATILAQAQAPLISPAHVPPSAP